MSDDDPFDDSSSDEDDADGFFSYKKQEFHKKKKNAGNEIDLLDTSPPPPRKRGRRGKHVSTTDDALSKLERRVEKQSGKPKRYDLTECAQDDDSDIEAEKEAAPVEAAEANDKSRETTIELLDSSDEEESDAKATAAAATTFHRHAPVAAMARGGMSRESCDKIAQARSAMYKLEQAQRYHGEDVYIPAPQPVVVVDVDHSSPTLSHQVQQKPRVTRLTTDVGPPILLTLKTTQVVNGKRSDASTIETMSIGTLEPFQKLLDRYQSQHNIVPSECSVKFSLRGEKIDLLKNPANYSLKKNDVVDVLTTSLVLRSSGAATAGATSTTANLGAPITVKLRTQEDNGKLVHDDVTIRTKEPLQKLVDKYKKHKKLASNAKVFLIFDGETMNMSNTPASYDMESDDIVEVVLK